MKKSGFTLAEILITMTIIGVVAALTAPALIHDASNARTGPALEKTKAAIELANQNILFRNRARNLLAVVSDDQTYLQQLAREFQNSTYLPADSGINVFSYTGIGGDPINGTRTYDGHGGEDRNTQNNVTPKLVLADNVIISVNADNPPYTNFDTNNNSGIGRRGSYLGPLANLLIDLNGVSNGPNVYGRDIFFFTVDRSGVVIPDGSELFYDYMTWGGVGLPADYECEKSGRACAGEILDNGRKVEYR